MEALFYLNILFLKLSDSDIKSRMETYTVQQKN